MTSQFDFTADAWNHISITPLLVGLAVAKAEDSGFFGSMRETKTLVSTIAAGVRDSPAKTLIGEAAAAETDSEATAFKAAGPETLADAAVKACEELNTLLAETAEPAEATGYREWVLSVGQSVAEAAKEEGVRVSPPEAALLERIKVALAVG